MVAAFPLIMAYVAAIFVGAVPATAQSGSANAARLQGRQEPGDAAVPVSTVPGDRVVCLYDKPSRKMICRTYDQWRVIGIQRSARRNFEKNADR
jgi:hypothetical protein